MGEEAKIREENTSFGRCISEKIKIKGKILYFLVLL